MNAATGKIYLVPTPLSDTNAAAFDIPYNNAIVGRLRTFVVEELRTARRYLRRINSCFPIDDCRFYVLNEHSVATIDLDEIMQEVLSGKDIGIMSEAGLPCIADPGSELVHFAHRKNIQVIPLIGASSIFMALMASGLGGQRFAFHGYLPTDKTDLANSVRKLEQQSRSERQTQIFMETPYRNMQLLEIIFRHCHGETLLCIACNITGSDEYIQTKSIAQWKKSSLPALHKKPTVFVLAVN